MQLEEMRCKSQYDWVLEPRSYPHNTGLGSGGSRGGEWEVRKTGELRATKSGHGDIDSFLYVESYKEIGSHSNLMAGKWTPLSPNNTKKPKFGVTTKDVESRREGGMVVVVRVLGKQT